MKSYPYGYSLSRVDNKATSFDNHIERRLSSLRGKFSDQKAFERLVDSSDPVVYEVYEIRRPEAAGELASGLSIVHSGRVGKEYFMTKGHYHRVRETAEIYHCLQGEGVLLMENEAGDTVVEDLHRGRVVYVTPCWAHRSINTGDADLVTFFVYPAHAGHDYAAIDATGFRKRLFEHDGAPAIVDSYPTPSDVG